MCKKEYIQPALQTIVLKMEQSLLQASGVYNQTGNGTQLAPGLELDIPNYEY